RQARGRPTHALAAMVSRRALHLLQSRRAELQYRTDANLPCGRDRGSIEPVVSTARRAAFPFLTPDGSGLIYAANPDSVDLSLWWRDLKSGRDVRLTSGGGEYTHPRLSSDGKRLVGTVIDSRQALERVAITFDRPVIFEPLTDGYSGDIDPVSSPDGSRLVFSTSRTGNRTIWSARGSMGRAPPITTRAAI